MLFSSYIPTLSLITPISALPAQDPKNHKISEAAPGTLVRDGAGGGSEHRPSDSRAQSLKQHQKVLTATGDPENYATLQNPHQPAGTRVQ